MQIQTVGIVGAGQMGLAISRLLCDKFTVLLCSRNEEKIKTLRYLKNIHFHSSLLPLSKSDLIIECVKEDFTVKKAIIQQLSSLLSNSKTLLATNTSSLNIDQLAADFWNPALFFGMHFMNPPEKMKFIELIKGNQTSTATIQEAEKFCNSIGHQHLLFGSTKECIVNRLLLAYLEEALEIWNEGNYKEKEIDDAMRMGAGMPLGPFQLADMIGLDTLLSCFTTRNKKVPNALMKLLQQGRLGRKSGRGFYNYN